MLAACLCLKKKVRVSVFVLKGEMLRKGDAATKKKQLRILKLVVPRSHVYTHVYTHVSIHVYTYVYMHMYTHV